MVDISEKLCIPMNRPTRVLPGFGLSMGYTLFYLSALVLLPLSTVVWKSVSGGWPHFVKAAFDSQAMAAYKLTFGASLIAAGLNTFFGLLVAWVLVRYSFPGRRLVDALVDLPFALPTAVGGIALATIYAPNGMIGKFFAPEGAIGKMVAADGLIGSHFELYKHFATYVEPYEGAAGYWQPEGIKIAYTQLGIVIALTFIGLPFVVRTVQPVLQEMQHDWEEAAALLGASRWQTFRRVLLPHIAPALLTGTALAFARAVGEYGSVIFISSNKPGLTQIVPSVIISKLDEFDYTGATAVATVMLVVSFGMLLCINTLQIWSARRTSA